ncbi:MAG: hypothetical protein VBE63_01260 [Lamprobacter sp.]|uniref:hypothetical protein n=1 Tax=Lamprobacter sp. TaxID=3100796 RepID=UPI002B25A44C|nr:hypothetical protein [Lamprobacter sp.]MEA3638555.1 hypothetical protein [Lamprobacter sp.]
MPCFDPIQPLSGKPPRPLLRNAGRFAFIGSLCLLIAIGLGGCKQVKSFPSGANTIKVQPGDTGNCALSPCRVLFEIPAGTADYQVLGNQVDFGRYPAGATANLGNFFEPIAIEVVGANVPKTYVYIPVEW